MVGGLGNFSKQLRKRTDTLYVCRPVLNADAIIAWAKSQGFETTLLPSDMHTTIAYSKAKLDWPKPRKSYIVTPTGQRSLERLGPEGKAVVLRFDSKLLDKRWRALRQLGASWDHEGYKPHITLSYKVPADFDLSKVKPYTGEILFGPERFEQVKENPDHVEKVQKQFDCTLLKADKDLGLVFGWAIVSTENGNPYYDVQGDHIPEDSMLEAAAEFMLKHRTMKVMHAGKKVGSVVFAWPMTEEIAKAMGISSKRTGLMIAAKPDSKSVITRFKDGKYTGFSIGGNRLIDEDVDD
jgi:putative serine protease XkdF